MIQKKNLFLFIILAYASILSFYPALSADFLNLDDTAMLTNNKYVTSLSFENIKNIFTHYHYRLYHPIVTLSYAIEYFFIQYDPFFFHLTNLIIHLLNTFILFFILRKITKNFAVSYIVAALFAVHPLHVETVAWISSRKDLLYALFYLLSILCYVNINESNSKIKMYCGALLCFVLSCMSKPMAVTLPVILVLIDYYIGYFTFQQIKKYIPFVLIASLFVLITIYGYYSPAETHLLTPYTKTINILNAHYNILFYIYKTIIPVNLSCLYPLFYNPYTHPPLHIMYSPAVLYSLFLFVFLSLKLNKKIFFGFLFFIITILPSSGVLPTGVAPVADRYAYIPVIGLFYIFAEFAFFIYSKVLNKKLFLVSGIAVIITLSFLSYFRTIMWHDTKTIVADAIEKYPQTAHHAYVVRGIELKSENKLKESELDFKKALSIFKNSTYAVFNMAHIAHIEKKYAEAKKGYTQIPPDSPDYISAVINLSLVLNDEGHTAKAIRLLERTKETYKQNYNLDLLYATLASLYFKSGKDTHYAIESLNKAIMLNPKKEQYYLFLMFLYEKMNDFQKFEQTASLGIENIGLKNSLEIENYIGKIYFQKNYFDAAENIFKVTVLEHPKNHTAYFFLGNISAIKQDYKQAVVYYTIAILSTKDNGEYYFKRSAAQMMLKNYKNAEEDMEKSLKKGFNIDSGFKIEVQKIKNNGDVQ